MRDQQLEAQMPAGDIAFVGVILVVFVVFMATLGWGAYQTRYRPKD